MLIQAARMNRQGKKLDDLVAPLPRPLEEGEFRLSIRTTDFAAYGSHVLEQLDKRIGSEPDWSPEIPNHEGLRVNCSANDENGWFLLRMSLHDPVMPLNIESSVKGGVDSIRRRLLDLLSPFKDLDLSVLKS